MIQITLTLFFSSFMILEVWNNPLESMKGKTFLVETKDLPEAKIKLQDDVKSLNNKIIEDFKKMKPKLKEDINDIKSKVQDEEPEIQQGTD